MFQITMKLFLLLSASYIKMAWSEPYIVINTRDSWFSYQQKKIAWDVYDSAMCLAPLNSTLSYIDCRNNGQIVKSISTLENSISIDKGYFNNFTNFYTINIKDSADNSCGSLDYFLHVLPYGKT